MKINQFFNFKLGSSSMKIDQFQGKIEVCWNSFWNLKNSKSSMKIGQFLNFKMGKSPEKIDQFQENKKAC
jgi:hypothetical protein